MSGINPTLTIGNVTKNKMELSPSGGAVKLVVAPQLSPIINVFLGGGGGGGVGTGNMTIYSVPPGAGDGEDGDGAYVVSTQKIMRKSGGSWSAVGQAAKLVSDSQVTFETPTAGDGTAELATP